MILSRATQQLHASWGPKYHTKRANRPIGEEGAHLHLFGDILAPSMSKIVLKPMVSSITTTPNYPRGRTLDPALLSCTLLDFRLFTLKSVDKSIKRRKWVFAGKQGGNQAENHVGSWGRW